MFVQVFITFQDLEKVCYDICEWICVAQQTFSKALIDACIHTCTLHSLASSSNFLYLCQSVKYMKPQLSSVPEANQRFRFGITTSITQQPCSLFFIVCNSGQLTGDVTYQI